MNSISIETLKSINTSLSDRIEHLANQLKDEHEGIKSSYWIIVEELNARVYISADNGYDISESIEVTDENSKIAIKNAINN